MIDGSPPGPNAVLSFKREGYKKTDFDIRDFTEVMTYPGFWKLAAKHRCRNSGNYSLFSKAAFVHSLQNSGSQASDLVLRNCARASLNERWQARGRLLIVESKNAIHVCNAPSPAATSSIEIGKAIALAIPAEMQTALKYKI